MTTIVSNRQEHPNHKGQYAQHHDRAEAQATATLLHQFPLLDHPVEADLLPPVHLEGLPHLLPQLHWLGPALLLLHLLLDGHVHPEHPPRLELEGLVHGIVALGVAVGEPADAELVVFDLAEEVGADLGDLVEACDLDDDLDGFVGGDFGGGGVDLVAGGVAALDLEADEVGGAVVLEAQVAVDHGVDDALAVVEGEQVVAGLPQEHQLPVVLREAVAVVEEAALEGALLGSAGAELAGLLQQRLQEHVAIQARQYQIMFLSLRVRRISTTSTRLSPTTLTSSTHDRQYTCSCFSQNSLWWAPISSQISRLSMKMRSVSARTCLSSSSAACPSLFPAFSAALGGSSSMLRVMCLPSPTLSSPSGHSYSTRTSQSYELTSALKRFRCLTLVERRNSPELQSIRQTLTGAGSCSAAELTCCTVTSSNKLYSYLPVRKID